jgi:hypothetical protein
MKKYFVFCALCLAPLVSAESATIKKASAVQEQKQDSIGAATSSSLVGTAINVFSGIQALKKQDEALSASCAPSGSDIAFVNRMVQEYAKTGKEAQMQLRKGLTSNPSCTNSYQNTANSQDTDYICYDRFEDASDTDRIWAGYPKSATYRLCPPDKGIGCDPKDEKNYSNAYEIYGYMNWSAADLITDEEAAQHTRLLAKIEECSPAVLKRKKQEMTSNLITSTIGAIGQQQNAGTTMQQVQGLMQGVGSGNTVGALGTMATGLIPGLLGN